METNTTLTPAAVLEEFFARFAAGDIEALLARVSDDVEWQVQGASTVPWTGTRRGRSAIADFFEILGRDLAVQSFSVEAVLGDERRAVAVGSFEFVVVSTGRHFASDFAIAIDVAQDRIVRYRMFEDSAAAAQAFRPPAA